MGRDLGVYEEIAMSKIKYIIFDWGGVCSHNNPLKDFVRDLSAKTGKSATGIENVFRELEYPFETGKITPYEFWEDLRNKLDISELSVSDIQSVMLHSCDLSNREVLDYILELKRNFKIVLFSNNYEDLFTHYQELYDFKKYFDFTFSSSAIGHKKPEPEAFQHVLRELNANPDEVVFVDDKEKNVVGASDLGIPTVHFKNYQQFKSEMEKII